LPVSEIKIDSSFIAKLPGSEDDGLIVRALVDLARALGIRSVAKGVESADAAAALCAMGCDAAQGWYFSRPLNLASATAWLADGHVQDTVSQRQLASAAPAAGEQTASVAAPPAGLLDHH
jgi:EAL domain-containing protein (putative c-di-GMP-specific phosphodiesterase class I)